MHESSSLGVYALDCTTAICRVSRSSSVHWEVQRGSSVRLFTSAGSEDIFQSILRQTAAFCKHVLISLHLYTKHSELLSFSNFSIFRYLNVKGVPITCLLWWRLIGDMASSLASPTCLTVLTPCLNKDTSCLWHWFSRRFFVAITWEKSRFKRIK